MLTQDQFSKVLSESNNLPVSEFDKALRDRISEYISKLKQKDNMVSYDSESTRYSSEAYELWDLYWEPTSSLKFAQLEALGRKCGLDRDQVIDKVFDRLDYALEQHGMK